MKNSNKKSINKLMLNEMKIAPYTKKEGIYAHLIIQVMKAANKFDKKLDNVYVDHNIIESILLTDSLDTYLHDNFGRSKGEFSSEFLKACDELKKQFDFDYPQAKKRNEKYVHLYYTPVCFGVRTFMRKVISKIVFPLGIKSKVQPIFVSLKMFRDGILNVAWYKGKKHGYYFMGEDYMILRNLSESEMILLENQIDKELRLNEYEVLEVGELACLIDAFIAKAA